MFHLRNILYSVNSFAVVAMSICRCIVFQRQKDADFRSGLSEIASLWDILRYLSALTAKHSDRAMCVSYFVSVVVSC